MSDMAQGCRVCATIASLVAAMASEMEEMEICTYRDLQRSAQACPTCLTIILCRFEGTSEEPDPQMPITLLNQRTPDSDLQIHDDEDAYLFLELAETNPQHVSRSAAMVLDEHWIDMEQTKAWLQYCDESHGTACKGHSIQAGLLPADQLLLIDVEEERLVSAPGTTPYFALSYVWGKDAPGAALETTVENVDLHRQKGALSLEKGELNLPDTIKDSLRLVKRLNARYLWVDRLCIIQNDYVHKAKQIGMMGAIYAHSYCTIIAAGGEDSQYGLRGVGGGSRPRRLTQKILDFPGATCVLLNNVLQAERSSLWNTRGWTFQEQIMSRRALIFADNSVTWRCQLSIWKEDLAGDPYGTKRIPPNQGSYDLFVPSPWPDIDQWAQLIWKYNRRNLSFESDRLVAIRGIETGLDNSFPGGFCYGLPQFFFDIGMLWQPASPMKRRSSDSQTRNKDYLPSWSWMGWHGTLSQNFYHVGNDYWEPRSRSTSFTTYPLVKWFSIDFEVNPTPISNDYHEWRKFRSLDNGELPDGWFRQRHDDLDDTYFTHPKAPLRHFAWPLPMRSQDPPPHSFTPYIAFQSTCAQFLISETIPSPRFCSCMTVVVRDTKGSWAGILRLNQMVSESSPASQICELVAISRGQAQNNRDESWIMEEWNLNERPQKEDVYEFYNVLLVERIDDWITRKALGRIEKEAWESQDLKQFDFKMR
ncbi:HET-domain-containing protein [Corynespora cassiicola Philippines]|uniref:HET-domain-containing protein n=1 Tax=Corynespora cassiicola Philippines TaxID=1448308 RepID=A0A2T2PCY0_CORCC|nr:HET-domain-containing protein [Corynespora cassiicola Philippines]